MPPDLFLWCTVFCPCPGGYYPSYVATSNPLQWHRNGKDGVSNHQSHDCLLNRLFRRRSKKTSKSRVTGLCTGNLPVTSEFPAQMATNAENVSIWRLHHAPVNIDAISLRWKWLISAGFTYPHWPAKMLTTILCIIFAPVLTKKITVLEWSYYRPCVHTSQVCVCFEMFF